MIELIDKRKPNEKRFLKDNGNIEIQMFRNNIHYLKDGKYEEISNELKENEKTIENFENDYKVIFYKKTGGIKYLKGDNYIEFIPKDYKNVVCILEKNTKEVSKVLYKNIIDNIDLEYVLSFEGVKENIIINEYTKLDKIQFDIKSNLTIKNENKVLEARKGKELLFDFSIPYMKDSNGNESDEVTYSVRKKEEDQLLTISFSNEWLKSKDRNYPIIIDPTFENNTNVEDTYIYPGDTNDTRYNRNYTIAGVEKINNVDRINRALMRFRLPDDLGPSDEVISAELHLYGYMAIEDNRELTEEEAAQNTQKLVNIHEVTSDWTLQNVNWNNINTSYNSSVENVAYISRSYLQYDLSVVPAELKPVICSSLNDCLITSLVKKWLNGSPNYGIMIKQATETYINPMTPKFFSSNYGNGSLAPLLTIEYVNQNGLETYLDYMCQPLTNGKMYVNTFNGNLVSCFNLAKTIGLFPANIGIVYNTTDALNINNIYGKGYKLTYDQTIELLPSSELNRLRYEDEDGTIHYFREVDNKYVDDDGLDLTVIVNQNECVMSDKTGNSLKFDLIGNKYILSRIKDIDSNEINITRNNSNYITKIVDSGNNEINISYNNNQISFVSSTDSTILNYENGNLKTIVTKDGTTTISYNNSDLISKVIDTNGLSFGYEYYSGSTKKIRKITHYGINNVEGESSTLEYGFFNTKITNNDGKVVTNIYNYYGNLISSNSMCDGVNINEAHSITNSFGIQNDNKNKELSNAIPIKHSNNYFGITNNNNVSDSFVFSSDTDIYNEPFDYDGVSAVCIKSTQSNGYIDYINPIGNNEILTISFDLKTEGRVNITFYDWQTQQTLYEKTVNNYTEFEKVVFTSTGSQFSFKIENEIANEYTYIGDIQFEKNETISNYNAIINSNFTNGTTGWDLTSIALDSDVDPIITDIFEVINIDNYGNKALKVNMESQNMNNITQVIPIKGSADDLYYLGFWYKNGGVETGIDPTSGIDPAGMIVGNTVGIYFEPLEGPIERCVPVFPLNANKDVWQYCYALFSPDENYKSIKIELHQGRDAGTLLITNFSLIKSLKTNRYEYDEYGNVSVVKEVNESNVFNYNKSNELISSTNPRGRHFKIEYDNQVTDRVIRAISSSGVSNKIVYDQFGNPIKTRMSKDYNDEINTGFYKIRQKGTNKYLKIENNSLSIKDDYCSNMIFKIMKQNNKYKISSAIIENKYITELSNTVVISNSGNNELLLEKNKNASYHIYIEDNEYNRKYLKWVDNHFEFVDSYLDLQDNYLYEYYLESSTSLFMESEAEYTLDGRFVSKIRDSLFNETCYERNNVTGLVTKKIEPNQVETTYTYNNKNQLTKMCCDNTEIDYTYSNDLLSTISSSNKEYQFNYDNFLNISNIKINNQNLITNLFENNNGNLLSTTFGNGDVISFQYDGFDQLKRIVREDNTFEYLYNNNGLIHKIKDNNNEIICIYDSEARLKEYIENRNSNSNNNFCIKNRYDQDNNVTSKEYRLNSIIKNCNYSYDLEGELLETNIDSTNIKYEYDDLLRLTEKKINNSFSIKYNYKSIGNRTSNIVKEYINGNNSFKYKYDKINNITDIYYNDSLVNHYEYDNLNQLVSDYNYLNNIKTEYSYNNAGNVTSKTKRDISTNIIINTDLFEYTNTIWEDLLTKYNNEVISYDSIGNPTAIGNKTLSWENGRDLASFSSNNLNVTYKYDSDGLRNEKVVNNEKTEYYLENGLIIFEKTNGNIIHYLYDGNGIIGLKNNNNTYYYQKNLQGDIIGIMDSNNQLLVKYEYDSYGNVLSIRDSNNQIISDPSNIGIINPFRYRGYYYDKETDLYYLNYRYYNPKWGRFINPDDGITNDINGTNLFLYCGNNPISRTDLVGNLFGFIVACVVVGVAATVVSEGHKNVKNGKHFLSNLGTTLIKGVLNGGLIATAALAPAPTAFLAAAAITSYGGAAVDSGVDEISKYVSGKKSLSFGNVVGSFGKVTADTVVNGTVNLPANYIGARAFNTISYELPKGFVKEISSPFTGRVSLQAATSTTITETKTFIFDSFVKSINHKQDIQACVFPGQDVINKRRLKPLSRYNRYVPQN